MKYHITTFGCQANERDSEIIAGILEEIGYEATPDVNKANLILFNTCCIREKAENKVLSKIGELKNLKAQRPDLIIGVAGCMPQQEKLPELLHRRAPHVNLIFGTHNIHELPKLIANIRQNNIPQIKVLPAQEKIIEGLPSKRQFQHKALVHITYGCNNFCTYCIVPYVRGREKSRQPQHIIGEIQDIVNEGVKEVMLLGQNVNSYGKDLKPVRSFANLLEEVDKIALLKRIRYMTSHPRDFSDELISVIAATKRVCPHFHLPVQAGSNKTLKLMNRGYTREDYLDLTVKIRRTFPVCSITTDFIVGFPGETDDDFALTLDLVKQVRFDSAFTFIYSPRSGTPASLMQDQIPAVLKKNRLQQLMNLQNKISLEINQQFKGETVEILVDGLSKTSQEMLTGRTGTNKTVLFEGPASLVGEIVEVKITSPQTWILKGELL